MLTQNITDELTTILSSLAQEGKEPTVALVKARLSTSVPIPALITAIKSWKASNRVPKVEVAKATVTDQDKLTQLEQQVSMLLKRVEVLEDKLNEKS
ncbi:hypothetical protein KP803_18905 [Vibrio sp. ZSDE26]|uniref:KfrA N-terminal DNA-binding domain-containing protein n=1 Tax=Vibrio amylolyticus TaxID=2847292 RepID=A0A9X2BJL7_9VIBR|nr:hypothetical protein [Vibrio amylolyticus]MCK6265340.1 hypothetical protein [Vibrio amylolyticus]